MESVILSVAKDKLTVIPCSTLQPPVILSSNTLNLTDEKYNGYQAHTVSLKNNKRKCWKGIALLIIQSTEKKGNITLQASSENLQSAILSMKSGD
jgi:glycosyl hydrolase family 2